jgi:hypothetical protein
MIVIAIEDYLPRYGVIVIAYLYALPSISGADGAL